MIAVKGKSLELEQPQYFVDGRGTLQAKKSSTTHSTVIKSLYWGTDIASLETDISPPPSDISLTLACDGIWQEVQMLRGCTRTN